jgi:hypothetical protein
MERTIKIKKLTIASLKQFFEKAIFFDCYAEVIKFKIKDQTKHRRRSSRASEKT